MFPRVQTLLRDRFKLLTHRETRELPIYALNLDRRDGKLGPKLQRSTCAGGRDGTQQPCGRFRSGPGIFTANGVGLSLFTEVISPAVQRLVVDQTGLAGTFDMELHWLPDDPAIGPQPNTPSPDPTDPSIFTALREQFGLKLEPARRPVDVFVIDRVEHPTED